MRATRTKKIDQKAGRAINRRLILNLIRTEGGLSRRELADRTGLSSAAVGFVVNDLLDEGYLLEGRPEGNGAGRKRVPLTLDASSNYAIGIRLSVDRLDCMLTDLGMKLIDSETVALASMSADAVVDGARMAVGALLARKTSAARILGAGFTSPGRFDPLSGICLRNHRFGWKNVPIGPMLSETLGMPVFTENDTMAFGLAHHLFGMGQSYASFIAVAVGAGIGCALVSGGEVYRGGRSNAGKVGHVLHNDPENGPVCDCGRRGCLQAWYAVPALEKRWRSGSHSGPLTDAVLAEDAGAMALVEEAGREIGKHLAEWVTALDPEVVILGGESVRYSDAFVAAMQRQLDSDYYDDAPPRILPDQSEFYWTAGAAAVAVQQLFGD